MRKVDLYTSDITKTLSLVLEEDGAPINLTDSTVTLGMYEIGSGTAKWSHECDIDGATTGLAHYDTVAGDVATIGEYYTLVTITYDSGKVIMLPAMAITIISGDANIVTVSEFLTFIDIKEENAKSDGSIKTYMEHAETLVDLEVPAKADTSKPSFIKLKKTLIMLKAGILYFMNSDEGTIDPNKRITKVQEWTKQYKNAMDSFNNVLDDSVEDGEGVIGRVKSSDYSDSSSYLYEG